LEAFYFKQLKILKLHILHIWPRAEGHKKI
jgi:hypothetical protein